MFRLLIALGLVVAAGPAWADMGPETPQPEKIQLRQQALIEGDVVRLGDIFDGLGDKRDTAISRAPAPGSRVELDARWLYSLAQGYGVAWQPASRLDHIVVERASQTISSERIESFVAGRLADRGLDGELTILLDNPSIRLHLPAEVDGTMDLHGLVHNPASGRFHAKLVAPATGPALAKTMVSGRAIAMTEVPVLHRQVAPGEVIRDRDISWMRVRADRVSRNIVVDAESLVGKTPRRPVRVEEMVRAGDLQEPVVVAKNSLVTIRLTTRNMMLTAQGRALEDGAAGEVVRVMNTKSNKIINAVVAGSSTVDVLTQVSPAAN